MRRPRQDCGGSSAMRRSRTGSAPQYRLQFRICQQITDAETLPRSQGIELHILAIQCHGIDLHPSGHDHPHG